MLNEIHKYILDHDNRWSFIIAYVTLAVVLAIVLNLFWLCVVMGVHAVFEWIKLRQRFDDWRMILTRVAWELKLDVGLVLFGLALGVYMEAVLGMLGIGHAARVAVHTSGKMAGRVAAWQNAIRGALLSLDDVAQVVRLVAAKNGSGVDGDLEVLDPEDLDAALASVGADEADEEEPTILGPWVRPYGWGDKISLGFGALCVALILISPYVTNHNWSDVAEIMAEELHPWPLSDEAGTLEELGSEFETDSSP